MLTRARFITPLITGILPAAFLAGCQSSSTPEAPSRTVSLAEFRRSAEPSAHQTPDSSAQATIGDQTGADAINPDQTVTVSDVVRETGGLVNVLRGDASDEVTVLPMDPGEQVFVDRMVGQVNGRPIFANEFFEPIDDQLRAESIRLRGQGQEFVSVASQIITNQLREVVLSDLFLAEAESNLTYEQQQGLFIWLRDIREQVVGREGQGSVARAQQRILAQEGVTLEEYLQRTRDQALIRQLLRDEVASRVVVSWRDVQRAYERNAAEFNPPSKATLARISLVTESRPDDIAMVMDRLARGDAFESIATDLRIPNDGRWDVFELVDHSLASIALSDRVKPFVVDLEIGQVSEPFEVGRSTWWVKVVSIEQPDVRSIYDADVQRELRQEIQAQRFAEEQNRYIQSLFEEGIYDELTEMNTRLLEMALLRYGNP